MTNVYIKRDGETTKLVENSLNNRAFQAYRADAMDLLKGVPNVKSHDKLLTYIKKMFDIIKKDNADIYEELMNKLAIKIVNLTTLDDLVESDESILNTIMSTYLYSKKKLGEGSKLFNYYKREVETVLESAKGEYVPSMAAIIKDIIRRYIRIQVGHYSEEELISVYRSIINGDDPLKYIKIEGIPFSELSDETLKYLVQKMIIPEINNKYDENSHHLCFDCRLPMKECPKMMDQFTKLIDQYDFITDGKQITHEARVLHRYTGPDRVVQEEINVEEVVDEFTVTKCKKFVK